MQDSGRIRIPIVHFHSPHVIIDHISQNWAKMWEVGLWMSKMWEVGLWGPKNVGSGTFKILDNIHTPNAMPLCKYATGSGTLVSLSDTITTTENTITFDVAASAQDVISKSSVGSFSVTGRFTLRFPL